MLHFERLRTANDARLEPSIKLYQHSFPRHERRSVTALRKALTHPEHHFNLIYDGSVLIGIILYWAPPQFTYIEHFCINPRHRNRRYGQRILAYLAKHAHPPIILEIEPPKDELTQRRKQFYRRAGYHTNSYPYQHTPYRPEEEPFPLTIMSWPKTISPTTYRQFNRYHSDTVMHPNHT